MATLLDIFRNYEIDLLEMISEQWGIEESIDWLKKPAKQIANALNDYSLFSEIHASLPDEGGAAFHYLLDHGGRAEREVFARKFGDIRELGAAIREKERPDRTPANAAEILFYHGLAALAFFAEKGETIEYYFIPDEFLAFTNKQQDVIENPEISPLTDINAKNTALSSPTRLAHILTLRLAALRGKVPEIEISRLLPSDAIPFLDAVLKETGVIKSDGSLETQKLKETLTTQENALIAGLFSTWRKSDAINDLRMVPSLTFEGQWVNDPIKPRMKILEMIEALPDSTWYGNKEFEQWVFETQPHFMRLGGEFEQWFIKNAESGEFLRGFNAWPAVDGAYIRYLITGPFAWFGLVQIAQRKDADPKFIFMKTANAKSLFSHSPSASQSDTSHKAIIHKNGEVYLPVNTQREMLYHFSRFCIWQGKNESYYKFRISPDAARRAEQQEISIPHIQTILRKYGQDPIPNNIFKALTRWERNGEEIQVEEQVIVRFKDPKFLKKFDSKFLKGLIVEPLNATTIIIRKKDIRKLENTLGEIGFLVENRCKYNQNKPNRHEGNNETI